MNSFVINIKNIINKILFILGYRISKINKTGELMKVYKYSDYDEYKKTQVYFNKKKLIKFGQMRKH